MHTNTNNYPSYTLITYSPNYDNPIPLNILQEQIKEGLFNPSGKSFRTTSLIKCGLNGENILDAYLSTVAPIMYPGWENDFLTYATEEDKMDLSRIFERILLRGAPLTSLLDDGELLLDLTQFMPKETPTLLPSSFATKPGESVSFISEEEPVTYYEPPSVFDAPETSDFFATSSTTIPQLETDATTYETPPFDSITETRVDTQSTKRTQSLPVKTPFKYPSSNLFD